MGKITLSFYSSSGAPSTKEYWTDDVMIGSDPTCDLVYPGLDPRQCRIYITESQAYYAQDLSGDLTINGRGGSGYLQYGDVLGLGNKLSIRFEFSRVRKPVEQAASQPVPPVAERSPQRPQSQPAPVQKPAPLAGTGHSVGTATVLSVLLPGAGQAYNGQPWKGLFVLIFSVLLLPWLLGIWDARKHATQIIAAGGRRGQRGGWLWVFFHVWLFVNVSLLSLIGLTLGGVLQ